MSRALRYTVSTSVVYTLVVGVAWRWALGLDFDWWKLPLIGALNALLNLIAFAITNSKKEVQDGKA